MAQSKTSITKNLNDLDETLDVVLQDIENHNKNGDKLVTFSIQPGDVILFYDRFTS
jgi:hypothetical protein